MRIKLRTSNFCVGQLFISNHLFLKPLQQDYLIVVSVDKVHQSIKLLCADNGCIYEFYFTKYYFYISKYTPLLRNTFITETGREIILLSS